MKSSSDDDSSNCPSPSKFFEHLSHKISEHCNAKREPISPPRIPPSGTPVKQTPRGSDSSPLKTDIHSLTVKSEFELDYEATISSSESEFQTEHNNEILSQSLEEGIQIAHLKPQRLEFTHVFPAFPKTHPNGYAYIIELSPELLNEKSILQLRDALQYSLTGGGGPRINENVKFFAVKGEKVPMKVHFRVCAGMSLKIID